MADAARTSILGNLTPIGDNSVQNSQPVLTAGSSDSLFSSV